MKKLFEETHIGNMTLKNRLVRSATWENLATEKGHMTPGLYEIYKTLAEGQAGLIITGYANVLEEEKPNPGMMGIYEDSFIPEYKKLTKTVHEYGSKIVMQIAYGGTKSTYQTDNRIIYSPSGIPERSTQVAGKPMERHEIDYLVVAFALAAERVKEAGFDGVEIHGAHTYLINQFLSPYYNRRSDEYGGSLKNRMRFLTRIYMKTREKVGRDFPIMVKLTASEFFEGGLTFEDTKQICRLLEELGVDAIEISGNIHGKARAMKGEVFDGHEIKNGGYFLDYAKSISEMINIPVMTVGGFKEPGEMEKILNRTSIEYFALSRPLLAEPHLFKRWGEGDMKPAICISCSKCRTPEGNYCTIFKNRCN